MGNNSVADRPWEMGKKRHLLGSSSAIWATYLQLSLHPRHTVSSNPVPTWISYICVIYTHRYRYIYRDDIDINTDLNDIDRATEGIDTDTDIDVDDTNVEMT